MFRYDRLEMWIKVVSSFVVEDPVKTDDSIRRRVLYSDLCVRILNIV